MGMYGKQIKGWSGSTTDTTIILRIYHHYHNLRKYLTKGGVDRLLTQQSFLEYNIIITT